VSTAVGSESAYQGSGGAVMIWTLMLFGLLTFVASVYLGIVLASAHAETAEI